jgi:hypothetical protein
MKPIYLGNNSIKAQKEGFYIPNLNGKGINTKDEAILIINQIISDYQRGFTYDHKGRLIKMTKNLAIKRLKFIPFIMKKSKASQKDIKEVQDIINYIIKTL